MKNSLIKAAALSLAILGMTSFTSASAADTAQAGPTDPEIAHIVVTANSIDIDAGKMAEKTSKSAEVKAFAKQMVTDHSAVNQQASDLAKKLGVVPKENATSKSLKDSADATMKSLKAEKGAAFDKAYVDNEVAFHQTVLDAIDKTLVPSAKNAELKALIVKVRPAIMAHLEHAKSIQSKMK
jgi:putative membrane protein